MSRKSNKHGEKVVKINGFLSFPFFCPPPSGVLMTRERFKEKHYCKDLEKQKHCRTKYNTKHKEVTLEQKGNWKVPT